MNWSQPPRMEDMAELARVGAAEPIETRLRLEQLRRELSDVIEKDPVRVANFGLVLEHGRAMLDRQLRHALMMLAERQDQVEVLTARVAMLEGRLGQVEQSRPRRWWW